jgi:hypothetical protein
VPFVVSGVDSRPANATKAKTFGEYLMLTAPLRIRTFHRALDEWEDAHSSGLTKIVVRPEADGRWRVWTGIGGEALELGCFSSRDAAVAQALSETESDRLRVAWAGQNAPTVIEADGPGWEYVRAAQTHDIEPFDLTS